MKLLGPKTILCDLSILRSTLQQFHPLLIEGHSRDTREASTVAKRITKNLQERWKKQNMTKPVIFVSQGDPLTERGISAITRHVSSELELDRCLVCLDADIDPGHSRQADRHGVIYEMKYSQLIDVLHEHDGDIVNQLTQAVDRKILKYNERRQQLGKDPLAVWFKDYALLQEVTKSAMKIICGSVTVAHATDDIQEFSVTSFYSVGLDLGIINENDMVSFF